MICECTSPRPFKLSYGTYCADCAGRIDYGDSIKIAPVPSFEPPPPKYVCDICGRTYVDKCDCLSTPVRINISSGIKCLYWSMPTATSRPTLHLEYLTEAEAEAIFKHYHTYGRVLGVGGIL